MNKLEEESTKGNEINKKIEKVEISVVFQKDRHPIFKKDYGNLKKNNDLKLNLKKMEGYKEEFPTDGISSTKRGFDGKNII